MARPKSSASDRTGPLLPGGYVDSHRHIVASTRPDAATRAVAWMDERHIRQAIVPSAIHVDKGKKLDTTDADKVLANYGRYPDRLYPMVSLHPHADGDLQDHARNLQALRDRGFVGFGESKWKGVRVDDPALLALYRAAGEAGLVVLLHIDNTHCVDDFGLPGLEKVLKALPRTRFVAHAQGWWAHISGDVESGGRKALGGFPKGKVTLGGAAPRLLDGYPNLYADLSANSGKNAIQRDLDHGLDFLARFQDKLLFGTDSVDVPIVGTVDWGNLDFFDELSLPQEVRARIGRDNARRLFDLPASALPEER